MNQTEIKTEVSDMQESPDLPVGEIAVERKPSVIKRTGLSATTLWRRVRDGTFPAPVDIGGGVTGWYSTEVDKWLKSRPRIQYKGTKPENKCGD